METTQLTGRVVYPGDPDYDEARQDYNARFDIYPAVIVFCESVTDVVNAVNYARDAGVQPSVRSGRHSYEAFSLVEGGIVIDVSSLQEIEVTLDPGGSGGGVAKVGAGVQLYPLYERLWDDGVTIPGGSCPTVGIAGLTLGGGLGLLGRQRGLTIDSLVELETVDAQGQVITANETTNPDLYWASRGGGGGNFGVVTSFSFDAQPIGWVSIFSMTWPWEELPAVTKVWQDWAPFTDPRLFSILKLNARTTGNIGCIGQFEGPAPELVALLAPLLAVGQPQFEVHDVPYIVAVRYFGGLDPLRPHFQVHTHASQRLRFKNTSAYATAPISDEGIGVLLNYLGNPPNDQALVQFDSLGGAIADVPPEATAFYHRAGNLFSLQYQAYWDSPSEDSLNMDWVEGFRVGLLPYVSQGAYRNYCDVDIADWPLAYYGGNFSRLVQTKDQYDGGNLFRYAQSIPTS